MEKFCSSCCQSYERQPKLLSRRFHFCNDFRRLLWFHEIKMDLDSVSRKNWLMAKFTRFLAPVSQKNWAFCDSRMFVVCKFTEFYTYCHWFHLIFSEFSVVCTIVLLFSFYFYFCFDDATLKRSSRNLLTENRTYMGHMDRNIRHGDKYGTHGRTWDIRTDMWYKSGHGIQIRTWDTNPDIYS